MSTIITRQPKADEFDVWQEVYQEYLTFYQTSLTEVELKKVWSWITSSKDNMHCYFAERENKIIGLTHFRHFIRPIKAQEAIFLDDLIVLPKYRALGAGDILIKAVANYAKQHQMKLVRWITAEDNALAMKLYDKVANKMGWITYDLNL